MRQYKSALILLLAFEGKSIPWDWWSCLLCRFPLTNFLYHFVPYYKLEIFIIKLSIVVRGAIGIGSKIILGEQTFQMLDIAFKRISLLKNLTAHFGKAALKWDLLLQQTWRVGEGPFTTHFQSILLKTTAFVIKRANQVLTTFP